MYLKFGEVSIWPNREVIRATILDSFKEKYSCTRVIMDCTEMRCQMPSSSSVEFQIVQLLQEPCNSKRLSWNCSQWSYNFYQSAI